MVSFGNSEVSIQTSPQPNPSTPSWFGEVTVIASYLRHKGLLTAIEERGLMSSLGDNLCNKLDEGKLVGA
jgi:hypothetical protein